MHVGRYGRIDVSICVRFLLHYTGHAHQVTTPACQNISDVYTDIYCTIVYIIMSVYPCIYLDILCVMHTYVYKYTHCRDMNHGLNVMYCRHDTVICLLRHVKWTLLTSMLCPICSNHFIERPMWHNIIFQTSNDTSMFGSVYIILHLTSCLRFQVPNLWSTDRSTRVPRIFRELKRWPTHRGVGATAAGLPTHRSFQLRVVPPLHPPGNDDDRWRRLATQCWDAMATPWGSILQGKERPRKNSISM